MKESKRKYQKKLKSKLVTFYLHEESLYQYAKSINFSRFVKEALKEAMKGNKHNG
jgi:dsRNA-specific ribonuclease